MVAFHGVPEPLPREEWKQKLAADGPGNGAFIRDVFVLEAYRRSGIGRNMMAAFAKLCLDRGWRRVDWHADRLDFDARTFYDMLCTDSFKLDRLSYRIEGDEIAVLAGKGGGAQNQG